MLTMYENSKELTIYVTIENNPSLIASVLVTIYATTKMISQTIVLVKQVIIDVLVMIMNTN